MTISILIISATLGSFLSAPDQRTLAYLDPGSGSFILQLLLAALVGSLFILKTYWKRIIAFFRKQRSDDDQGDEE